MITLDLDLKDMAMKLQSSTGNTNWLLRVGELHACFASFHAIEKYIEGSGLDSIGIEAGLYSPSTINQIFTGKWLKHGVTYHITNILACYDLLFEAFSQQENLETMVLKCHELHERLHMREGDITDIFVKYLYSSETSFMPQELYEAGREFNSPDSSEQIGRVGASSWCH